MTLTNALRCGGGPRALAVGAVLLVPNPWAAADITLFDNGPFITSHGTGFGGADVSRAEGSTPVIGFSANAAPPGGPIRLTEDFTVTGAPVGGARLSHMHFYASHGSPATTTMHYTAFYIALYDGNPAAGGQVIAGDLSTNRLISTAWSGAYRVGMTGMETDSSRPILRLDVDMSWAPKLHNGTYWMLVSAIGDTSVSANPIAYAPFVTPHSPSPNALQYFNSTWFAIWDLPFTLFAFCPGDFNGSHSVSVQDLFDFLAAWFAHDPSADVNASGGVTVQDLFDFLAAWFAGCP